MKALVAITCLAVLGALAYLGWNEFERRQVEAHIADLSRERAACIGVVVARNRAVTLNDKRTFDAPIGDCLDRGIIDRRDIQGAGL